MEDSQPIMYLNVGQLKAIIKELANEGTLIPVQPETEVLAEVFGVKELMKITNYTKSTIYKLVEDGIIPAHQPRARGKIFFHKHEIRPWLMNEQEEKQNSISPLLK